MHSPARIICYSQWWLFGDIWGNIYHWNSRDLWTLQTNFANDQQVSTAFMTTAKHLVSKCTARPDPECTLNAPACSALYLFNVQCLSMCVCLERYCVPEPNCCFKIISVLSQSSGDRLHLYLLFVKMLLTWAVFCQLQWSNIAYPHICTLLYRSVIPPPFDLIPC